MKFNLKMDKKIIFQQMSFQTFCDFKSISYKNNSAMKDK